MDPVLAGLLALWGLVALLPVGVWTGLADGAYYGQAWALWWRTLLVASLGAGLLLVLTRGAIAPTLRRLLARGAALPPRVLLPALGIAAAAEAVAVSVWGFARQPQAIDAWVQFFQARIFLSGRMVAPPPPSAGHFVTLFLPVTERGWFSQYPPIHPALIALGMVAGAGWLVTPLLAALLPAAVHLLGRRAADPRVAPLAAGLTLLSPFVMAMDASGMNHLPAALCVAAGLGAIPDVARGRLGAGVVLAAAIGLGLGLRPLDAGLVALLAAPALLRGLRAPGGPAMLAAAAATGLAALAPTLAYNAATTGSPLTFTYAAIWRGLELGLGHATPWGETLTATRALGLTAVDGHQLDVYLLEWPLPATALLAAGLWAGGGRLDTGLRVAAGYVLALVAALFLYFHRDTMYGPRLLFSAVPALLVLLAAALVRLADCRSRVGWRTLTLGDLATTLLAVTALVSAATLVPKRLASYGTAGTAFALHPDADARRAGLHDALVLVPEGWGSRIIARLWAAGVPMTDSTRVYDAFDACALEELLADATARGVRDAALVAELATRAAHASPGVAAPGVTRDPRLRLPADRHVTPRCGAEIERDRRGTLQFAPYLYLNAATLDGDVVWARELGADDAGLAQRFPGRTVWRYTADPKTGTGTFTPALVPEVRTR